GDESISAIGGIGSYAVLKTNYNPCNVYISGGNIKCGDGTKDGVWGNPKNVKNGIDVFWTKIGLEGCASGKDISKAEFDSLGYTYGLQDVKTLDSGSEPKNGTVWFYLPEDQSITRADAKAESGNDTVYCGDVKAKAAGMLYPATKITLKALEEGDKGSDGTAYIAKGLTELHSVTEPKVAGYTIESYSLEKGSAESLIVNKKTELRAGVSGYTDETGKWMHESVSEGLTFYAVKKPINFKIHFDPNKPAESAEEPTGNVEDINIQYGIPQDLPNSGFSIEGYGFKYWNKSRGDSFIVDKDTACRLTTNQGETVTVYAIWEAQTYKIKYNDDQGNIIEDTPEIKYNQHVKLQSAESLGFRKDGHHFGGWTTSAMGSFYDDEEEICNLCTVNDDDTLTGKTLTAVWIPDSVVSVAVTNDGVPVTDLDGKITLNSTSGTKIENLKYNSDSGCYEEKGVPDGRYNISIEGYNTDGCIIDVDKATGGHAVLDYYTVSASTCGPGSDKAFVSIAETAPEKTQSTQSLSAAATDNTKTLEKILDNTSISISTEVTDDDYVFGGYTASGVQPQWDPNKAVQTITIQGQTQISANIRQKQYKIAFAKNADDATGDMKEMEMTCGVERHLRACDFEREGYEFAGWTTTEKWKGTTYKDCQKVNDLTTEDGATVTLYAQWNPDPYFIDFDDNGSLGLMLSQKCFRDLESEISPNEYYMPAYHFTGWNTEDMGTGTSYADKARVLNLAHSKDERVTLYAQWEHDKYTIKFKANGGKGKMADQVMYSRCLFPLDLNRFTRSGYKFVGWSVAKNGHGYSYTDGAEVIDLAKPGRSVTLYAQWLKSGDYSSDTGDNSKLILAAILTGAALAAGLTVVFIRRREKYKC
ncbi:MAG: InlB B-repeat-containing protein, partial [Clostridia bacterium]|nr:InlB B-repeat-containing protein [Clostridia bacterium]